METANLRIFIAVARRNSFAAVAREQNVAPSSISPALRVAFPRLQFELLFTDDNLDLIADRVDLAIRLAPSYRADIIGTKLFPTRHHAVASPKYLRRERAPQTPRDLAGHSCL